MDINELPKDMQEIVLKLASQYPITIEEAKEFYLMGGDHAEKLCEMRTADMPFYFIQQQNHALWEEKNKGLWDELKSINLLFKDKDHEKFYTLNVEKTNSHKDPYRKALFYALGLTAETRRNIDRLYNYKDRCIEFDGLKDGWQTGTSMRVTRLAFNLFNGFNGDLGEGEPIDDRSKYTPYELFDNSLMVYMLEAVKLLYPSCVLEVRG